MNTFSVAEVGKEYGSGLETKRRPLEDIDHIGRFYRPKRPEILLESCKRSFMSFAGKTGCKPVADSETIYTENAAARLLTLIKRQEFATFYVTSRLTSIFSYVTTSL